MGRTTGLFFPRTLPLLPSPPSLGSTVCPTGLVAESLNSSVATGTRRQTFRETFVGTFWGNLRRHTGQAKCHRTEFPHQSTAGGGLYFPECISHIMNENPFFVLLCSASVRCRILFKTNAILHSKP